MDILDVCGQIGSYIIYIYIHCKLTIVKNALFLANAAIY